MRFPLVAITVFSFLQAAVAEEEDVVITGDVGAMLYQERCIACHLTTGLGGTEVNAPSIAGLPRWYVTDQLRKFRSHERGSDPRDVFGAMMRINTPSLDERSIAFLGKYIESLAPNDKRKTLADLASEESPALYKQHCADCHGAEAEGNRKKDAPALRLQPDWYLLRQMENFEAGIRPHTEDEVGAANLTRAQLRSLIAWLAALSAGIGEDTR